MRENLVQPTVLLTLGQRPDVRVFRNHTGQGWSGEVVRRDGDTVLLRNARAARFGLAPGSSDVIGLQSIIVTPDMVGRRLGVFLAAEVKGTTTPVEERQQKFLDMVSRFGGIAGVARSPEDALALLIGGGA